MTKLIPLLLAAAIAAPAMASSSARAADAAEVPANVKATFGNTLFTIDPDGRARKIWFTPDGNWTGLSRTGKDLAGTWKIDDSGKVCLKQSKPALPFGLCQKFPDDLKVDGGEVTDPSGKSGKLKLVKGHVTK